MQSRSAASILVGRRSSWLGRASGPRSYGASLAAIAIAPASGVGSTTVSDALTTSISRARSSAAAATATHRGGAGLGLVLDSDVTVATHGHLVVNAGCTVAHCYIVITSPGTIHRGCMETSRLKLS